VAAAEHTVSSKRRSVLQYLLDGHGVERKAEEALTLFRHAARQ